MEGRSSSITEAFKSLCPAYLTSLRDPEHCKKTVLDIHKHFNTFKQTLGYDMWVDDFTEDFSPKDYFKSLTSAQKDKVLITILFSSIDKFTQYILQTKHLKYIVDDRTGKASMEILQNKMIDILTDEREMMYHRFVQQLTNTSPHEPFIESLREEIKRTSTQLEQYKTMVDTLTAGKEKIYNDAKAIITSKNQQIQYLIDRSVTMEKEKEMLLNRIRQLSSNESKMVAPLQISQRPPSPPVLRSEPPPQQTPPSPQILQPRPPSPPVLRREPQHQRTLSPSPQMEPLSIGVDAELPLVALSQEGDENVSFNFEEICQDITNK
jgi:hypothetical protein